MSGYANASPRSKEEIKEDNSSSNSFLLHPSVMEITVHILAKEVHLLRGALRCVCVYWVGMCVKMYVF